VAVLYSWCRYCDDAVDLAPVERRPEALARLRSQLDQVYGDAAPGEPLLDALQEVARKHAIPRHYGDELLAGMAMDVEGRRYATLDELLLYCHRVAGVVGLMMCHVLGVSDARALVNAVHLGMAMQLTNICRDVLEDWRNGRLYLPSAFLSAEGAGPLQPASGTDPPPEAVGALGRVVGRLLREADAFYASGDAGAPALPWRASLAVRAARWIYARIGRRVEAVGCDVMRGRAVVPGHVKLVLVFKALGQGLWELPGRWVRPFQRVPLDKVLGFPHDLLPVERCRGMLGDGKG
jgi:phytoene synthase